MADPSDSNARRTKKARKTTERIKWTEEMEVSILQFAKDKISTGKGFEKPSAMEYYRKFLLKAEGFEGVTPDKLNQHMKALKKSYTDALQWRNKTGEGILADDPENGAATIEVALKKRCKYFAELDEILGDKPQFKPPFVFESSTVDLTLEQNELDLEDSNDTKESLVRECSNENKRSKSESPEDTPVLKRRDAVGSASAALQSAMNARVKCEESRLQWEKEITKKQAEEKACQMAADQELKQSQLAFEKQKWNEELQLRKLKEDRNYELEKLKIEHEASLQRFKAEKEFELQKIKLAQTQQ